MLTESNKPELDELALLFDKRAAAKALSVSKRMIDILIARKQLSSINIGRRRLIRRSDLLRFIKKGA